MAVAPTFYVVPGLAVFWTAHQGWRGKHGFDVHSTVFDEFVARHRTSRRWKLLRDDVRVIWGNCSAAAQMRMCALWRRMQGCFWGAACVGANGLQIWG